MADLKQNIKELQEAMNALNPGTGLFGPKHAPNMALLAEKHPYFKQFKGGEPIIPISETWTTETIHIAKKFIYAVNTIPENNTPKDLKALADKINESIAEQELQNAEIPAAQEMKAAIAAKGFSCTQDTLARYGTLHKTLEKYASARNLTIEGKQGISSTAQLYDAVIADSWKALDENAALLTTLLNLKHPKYKTITENLRTCLSPAPPQEELSAEEKAQQEQTPREEWSIDMTKHALQRASAHKRLGSGNPLVKIYEGIETIKDMGYTHREIPDTFIQNAAHLTHLQNTQRDMRSAQEFDILKENLARLYVTQSPAQVQEMSKFLYDNREQINKFIENNASLFEGLIHVPSADMLKIPDSLPAEGTSDLQNPEFIKAWHSANITARAFLILRGAEDLRSVQYSAWFGNGRGDPYQNVEGRLDAWDKILSKAAADYAQEATQIDDVTGKMAQFLIDFTKLQEKTTFIHPAFIEASDEIAQSMNAEAIKEHDIALKAHLKKTLEDSNIGSPTTLENLTKDPDDKIGNNTLLALREAEILGMMFIRKHQEYLLDQGQITTARLKVLETSIGRPDMAWEKINKDSQKQATMLYLQEHVQKYHPAYESLLFTLTEGLKKGELTNLSEEERKQALQTAENLVTLNEYTASDFDLIQTIAEITGSSASLNPMLAPLEAEAKKIKAVSGGVPDVNGTSNPEETEPEKAKTINDEAIKARLESFKIACEQPGASGDWVRAAMSEYIKERLAGRAGQSIKLGDKKTYKIDAHGNIFEIEKDKEIGTNHNISDIENPHPATIAFLNLDLQEETAAAQEKLRAQKLQHFETELRRMTENHMGEDTDKTLESIKTQDKTTVYNNVKDRIPEEDAFDAIWLLELSRRNYLQNLNTNEIMSQPQNFAGLHKLAGVIDTLNYLSSGHAGHSLEGTHTEKTLDDDRFFSSQVYEQLKTRDAEVDSALLTEKDLEVIQKKYGAIPTKLSRQDISEIALQKFKDLAHQNGIALTNVTQAMFEGRLNPHFNDLSLANKGFGRPTDKFILSYKSMMARERCNDSTQYAQKTRIPVDRDGELLPGIEFDSKGNLKPGQTVTEINYETGKEETYTYAMPHDLNIGSIIAVHQNKQWNQTFGDINTLSGGETLVCADFGRKPPIPGQIMSISRKNIGLQLVMRTENLGDGDNDFENRFGIKRDFHTTYNVACAQTGSDKAELDSAIDDVLKDTSGFSYMRLMRDDYQDLRMSEYLRSYLDTAPFELDDAAQNKPAPAAGTSITTTPKPEPEPAPGISISVQPE